MQRIEDEIDVEKNGAVPPGYRGSVKNGLMGLLFLVSKFHDCRAVISFALRQAEIGEKLTWTSFSFYWNALSVLLTAPGKDTEMYKRTLQKCLCGPEARWLATPLILRSTKDDMHANFLLLHIPTKRLFRFEPYGQSPLHYRGLDLDQALVRMFQDIFAQESVSLFSPQLKDFDVQRMQETEKLRHKRLEPGYCQAFCVLYACVQIENSVCSSPESSRCQIKEAAKNIRLHFDQHPGRITAWIRAFCVYLAKQYKLINIKAVDKKTRRAAVLAHMSKKAPAYSLIRRVC